jgi:hypothetical protein
MCVTHLDNQRRLFADLRCDELDELSVNLWCLGETCSQVKEMPHERLEVPELSFIDVLEE